MFYKKLKEVFELLTQVLEAKTNDYIVFEIRNEASISITIQKGGYNPENKFDIYYLSDSCLTDSYIEAEAEKMKTALRELLESNHAE